MKQTEIAKKLKTTQGAVSHWINARAIPNLQNAIKLKEFYGLPLEIWGDRKKIKAFLKKNKIGLTYFKGENRNSSFREKKKFIYKRTEPPLKSKTQSNISKDIPQREKTLKSENLVLKTKNGKG